MVDEDEIPTFLLITDTFHCWFLEPWNREKVLHSFDNIFHVYLMNGLQKYQKKFFLHGGFLRYVIHIIHFEIWDLKKILGYDINYLSIWPFMGLPWFPTRKASKLPLIGFQL